MKEMSKKCSTDQRFILKRNNFLKNPYFSSRAGLDFYKKYNDLLLNWYYFLKIWPGKIHFEANKILVHSTENQYGLRNLGQTLGRCPVPAPLY